MQEAVTKFLLLLSGSGMSHKEIREIAAKLRYFSPTELADAVRFIRRNALDPLDEVVTSILSGTGPVPGKKKMDRSGSDVPLRVVTLLKFEAGLTVKEAALELLNSLEQRRPGISETIKPPNKESFYGWLQRLSKRIEPSELLHHASRIRNRYVHQVEQDWPLLEG